LSCRFYGCAGGEEEMAADDPDAELVPELVEMVVLVKMAGLLEFVYDPRSASQTGTVSYGLPRPRLCMGQARVRLKYIILNPISS